MKEKNVIFLYKALRDEINFGIAFLIPLLKKYGYNPSLICWDNETTEEEIISRLSQEKGVLLISALSQHWYEMSGSLPKIKEAFDGPVIIGGWHAIISPEDIYPNAGVDGICLGDGEEPILYFLDHYFYGKKCPPIPGLAGKKGYFTEDFWGGHWYVRDLNIYPYAEYDMFPLITQNLIEKGNPFYSPGNLSIRTLSVLSGRGCPFRCNYCNNTCRMQLFPSLTRYLRKIDPEILIFNLAKFKREYDVEVFHFNDELFDFNRKWLNDFLPLYSRKIGLPFSCTVRIDHISEDKIAFMAKHGLKIVIFGLESGDENYRKKYLNKKITDEQIKRGVDLLKRHDLIVLATNMIGMPFETEETMRKTIEMNQELDIDISYFFAWQPLPKTKLAEMALKEGILEEVKVDYYYKVANLKEPPRELVEKMLQIAINTPNSFLRKEVIDRNIEKLKQPQTKKGFLASLFSKSA